MRWTQADYVAYLARQSPRPEGEMPANVVDHSKTLTLRKSTDEAKLNKLETAYLTFLRSQGCAWIGIQSVTLKLASDCRLTPDFTVLVNGELTFIDVKGFQREDALIKMKMAARSFPWASFEIVKRKNGEWIREMVKP